MCFGHGTQEAAFLSVAEEMDGLYTHGWFADLKLWTYLKAAKSCITFININNVIDVKLKESKYDAKLI
jgi:hypothetical protein